MGQKANRQTNALSRLENQLASGKKIEKKSTNKISLSDSDKKRIEKEIEILKKTK